MEDQYISKTEMILSKAPGNPLDIYYAIVNDCLFKSQNPGVLLKIIVSHAETVGKDDEAPGAISEDEASRIESRYSSLLNNVSSTLADTNPTQDEYYTLLYQYVFNSDLFPRDRKVQAVLLKMMAAPSRGLPYYQIVDPLEMEDDEFSNRASALVHEIFEAMHYLGRRQCTLLERISQLCRIADRLDETDRVVFWTGIISVSKPTK